MRVPLLPYRLSSPLGMPGPRIVAYAARAGSTAVLTIAVGAALACASGGGPPVVRPTPTSRGTMDVLTAEELRIDLASTTSLYERVRVLRVGFVQGLGQESVVLLDGRYAGPLSVLDEIPVHAVREVRRLRGIEVPLIHGRRTATALNVLLRH